MSVDDAVISEVTEVEPAERRKTARFNCTLPGNCQPIAALEAGNHWPAQAADVSRGGVNLLIGRRFEPGTFLAIEFTMQPNSDSYMPLARVCHVTRDNLRWRLGCVWAKELSDEDLRALVGQADVPRQAA